MKKILSCLVTVFLFVALVGCSIALKNFTVSFDTDGGTEIESIIVASGKKIELPEDPVKEGFTFGGWYADIDLVELFDTETLMPKQNITLYAKWLVTLSFESNGGSKVADIVGEPGGVFNLPENPTREGYVFVGWYYDAEYQNKLTYVMPRQNSTVYARWQVFEEGSAIVLSNDWLINDEGSFIVSKVDEGTKIEATSAKGSWSYVYVVLDGNAKENTTVVVVLQGMKDVSAVLKLEGGNAEAAIETSVTFTGEEQRIEWTVEAKNLTSVGGQKFLIFLNGGVEGCGETPEYVIVKSIGLYRTIDADEPQRAILSFMTNGGTEIESYYLEPGTAIEAPADPEKEGYVFAGWFKDKELTEPYEFSVMPSSTTNIYAKWEAAEQYLPDCDLMGGEFRALDEGTYEIQNNADSYVLKKTELGLEWQCMVLPMTDKKLAGYNLLRVELQGTKGEQVLFKINDSNVGERWVTLTGEKQYLELPFDFDLDNTKSLVVFINGGVAGESGTVTITKLAYGNYSKYINLLVDGWYCLNEDVYDFALEDGALKLSKRVQEGFEWACLLIKLEDVSFVNFDTIKIRFQGPQGEQLLIKLNDRFETWVDCTGEVQELEIPYDIEIDNSKATMVIFANPGAQGTGNEFVISEFALTMSKDPAGEDPVEVELVDLLEKEFKPLDEGMYVVEQTEGKLTVTKTSAGGEWNCIVTPADSSLDGLTVLRLYVTIQGTSGEQLLLKLNDQFEYWVTCDGTVQELSFDVNQKIDGLKNLFVIFANGGAQGTGNPFEITQLVLDFKGEEPAALETIDVLAQEFNALDEGMYTIEQTEGQMIITKNETGGEWNCIVTPAVDAVDGLTVKRLFVTVQGTNEEQILLKLNDQFEYWVTCDGTVQELSFDVNQVLSGDKNLFVIFANGGAQGTGNPFTITRLVIDFSEDSEEGPKSVDLRGRELRALDDNTYDITVNADSYVIQKLQGASEWSCMVIPMTDLDLTHLNLLNVQLQGSAGDKVMFKINDSEEHVIELDGTRQYFDISFETSLDSSKPLTIFVNVGTAGESGVVTIYYLSYSNILCSTPILQFVEPIVPDTYGAVLNEGTLSFSKKTTGYEWDCILLPNNASTEGLKMIQISFTVQGPNGEDLLLKPNDSQEIWISCTGEVQQLSISLDITIDSNKAILAIFANPNANGTGNTFTISNLNIVIVQ